MAKRSTAELTIEQQRIVRERLAAQVADLTCYTIDRLVPAEAGTYGRQAVLESVIERLKARV